MLPSGKGLAPSDAVLGKWRSWGLLAGDGERTFCCPGAWACLLCKVMHLTMLHLAYAVTSTFVYCNM